VTPLPQDDSLWVGFSFPTFPHRARKDGAPSFMFNLDFTRNGWATRRKLKQEQN
jgi:hypothetical protein